MDITTAQGRQEYMVIAWPTLAAYAYAGYKKYGRGVLVLECTETGPTDNMQFWHGAAAEEAGVTEQAASYDPEQEILLVFAFPDGNKFVRFRPDNEDYAPPLMAAQAPETDELWQDAEQ